MRVFTTITVLFWASIFSLSANGGTIHSPDCAFSFDVPVGLTLKNSENSESLQEAKTMKSWSLYSEGEIAERGFSKIFFQCDTKKFMSDNQLNNCKLISKRGIERISCEIGKQDSFVYRMVQTEYFAEFPTRFFSFALFVKSEKRNLSVFVTGPGKVRSKTEAIARTLLSSVKRVQ